MSRVLVVDDERDVAELVRTALRRSGHDVEVSLHGEDALTRLRESSFDLLVVDKNLPRMHGFEVIARAQVEFPQLAVVMMTAHPEPFAVPPTSIDGYLTKPFTSMAEIVAVASAALETRRARDEQGLLDAVVEELAPVKRRRR